MTKIITFDNGLRLVCDKMTTTRSLSIGVFVGVGSLYENLQNNGISHFIEHMFFKGTTTRTAFDIANELESIGVNVNAYTSKSATAYYTSGLSEYGDKCMQLLADIYYNSTFDSENLDKEREVILEEIKMSEDDYEDLSLENLCKAIFGKNKAVAYPILGSEANVARFGKSDITTYLKEHYVPQNTVISMAGDITIENAKALVEKHFDTKINSAFEKTKFGSEKILSKYIQKVKSDSMQSHITIGFPAFGIKNKDSVANTVISNILGGGMSSRLFQKVREELGLVYTIYASTIAYSKTGYLYIYFATDPSKVGCALKAVKECLEEIKKTGIYAEELARTIVQVKTSTILGMESSMSTMRANARSVLLLNKKFKVSQVIKELDKFNLEKANSLLNFYLNFDKVSVSYVGQKPTFNPYKLFKGEDNVEI